MEKNLAGKRIGRYNGFTESVSAVRDHNATINLEDGTFPRDASTLQAARLAGIEIPVLCDDQRLKPYGACRMCLVEIKGWSHSVASCMTELKRGMGVETHTREPEDARKMNLRMLARNIPLNVSI